MVLPSAREAGGDTSVSQPQWRMAGKLSGGESRPSGTKEYIITIIMGGGQILLKVQGIRLRDVAPKYSLFVTPIDI